MTEVNVQRLFSSKELVEKAQWNNTHIYKNFEDEKIKKDIDFIESKLEVIQSEGLKLRLTAKKLDEVTNLLSLLLESEELCIRKINTLRTFASSTLSVDSLNEAAEKLYSLAQDLSSKLQITFQPVKQFILKLEINEFTQIFNNSKLSDYQFYYSHLRKQNVFILSDESEIMLETLKKHGLTSWGNLYNQVSSQIKVELDGKLLSISNASNNLFQADSELRKKSYQAINKAWRGQEVVAASIINSINGFRADENKLRSVKQKRHFLDQSVHEQRVSRKTLDALINSVATFKETSQKALKLMALEIYGKNKVSEFGPWDVLAGFPEQSQSNESVISFDAAIKLVSEAFATFDTQFSDFVLMMYDKKWIDAVPTENRRQGAFCSVFFEYNEPRVFLTFDGSMKNVITLAHELGHAYHSWVLNGEKFVNQDYPMTLAETASVFAETLLRQHLLNKAKTKIEKKKILWQEIESIASFLVNIPMRYEFEYQVAEQRQSQNLIAEDFKVIMRKASEKWYGQTLSEHNDMFWASKLHFSMSDVSFYNYPYLFGYLFSLNLISKQQKIGSDFSQIYVSLLKDTGRMTAEDLIKKYFNENIEEEEFWNNSLEVVKKIIQQYEELV